MVASAAVALYRRAQEIASRRTGPSPESSPICRAGCRHDLETIPDDLRAAAEEGAAAAERRPRASTPPGDQSAMRAISSRLSTSRFGSPPA